MKKKQDVYRPAFDSIFGDKEGMLAELRAFLKSIAPERAELLDDEQLTRIALAFLILQIISGGSFEQTLQAAFGAVVLGDPAKAKKDAG